MGDRELIRNSGRRTIMLEHGRIAEEKARVQEARECFEGLGFHARVGEQSDDGQRGKELDERRGDGLAALQLRAGGETGVRSQESCPARSRSLPLLGAGSDRRAGRPGRSAFESPGSVDSTGRVVVSRFVIVVPPVTERAVLLDPFGLEGAERGSWSGVRRLPGGHWLEVTAALVDVLKLVVLRPTAPIDDRSASVLAARLRSRSAALVVWGEWPRPDARLGLERTDWSGVGQGYGVLRERRARVVLRRDGRPVRAELVLP